MPSKLTVISALGFVAAVLPQPVLAQADSVPTYTAHYEVRYKGRRVAEAEFGVSAIEPGQYEFQSSTSARGLLRLTAPNPAIERSRFRLDSARLEPSSFEHEDGSRKGEDNFAIAFDKAGNEIRVTGPEVDLTLPFAGDLLDRGSLQVALMRDLGNCAQPGPYRYVDDDGINTYHYSRLEDLATDTGIGEITAVRFAQERQSSSRRTILWLSPDYQYLPIRIEQIRDGEIETVFTLDALTGIAKAPSQCSGFR